MSFPHFPLGNIIPKRIFQTTLDGSEIPNNHLGCIKPCKKWDILPYQLVNPGFLNHQQYHPNPSVLSSSAAFKQPLTSKFPRPIAALPMHGSSFPGREEILHPGKLTWNLKITYLKRKVIFQTCIFGFHVNFQGCTFFVGSISISIQFSYAPIPFCKRFWSGLFLT